MQLKDIRKQVLNLKILKVYSGHVVQAPSTKKCDS